MLWEPLVVNTVFLIPVMLAAPEEALFLALTQITLMLLIQQYLMLLPVVIVATLQYHLA
jgi:hypothetical protein